MKAVAKKSTNQKRNKAIANLVFQQKSNGQGALTFVNNNRAASVSQDRLRLMIDNSPRTLAQKQQLASSFGMPLQRQGWYGKEELLSGRFEPVQKMVGKKQGQLKPTTAGKHVGTNAEKRLEEHESEVNVMGTNTAHEGPDAQADRVVQPQAKNRNSITIVRSRVIQREISEEQFVEDTTSSILWCIKWRSGNARDLARMQRKLRVYEEAREVVAKVQALEDVYETAQRTRAERGSKLYRALMRIKVEAQQIIIQLKQEPEYQVYEKGLKARGALAREEIERRMLGTPYADATPKERNLRLVQYKEQNPGYAFLVDEMDGTMSEAQVLSQLVDNFFDRTDFTYTFNASSPFKGVGDCQTLRNEYIQVARDALGIALDRGDTDTPAYVKGGGRIIDKNGLTGNVDNGSHWLFENHHWAVWKGTPIDILYGLYGALKASVPAQSVEDEPLLYYKSGKTRIYVARKRWPGNSYTLDPELAMENPYYEG